MAKRCRVGEVLVYSRVMFYAGRVLPGLAIVALSACVSIQGPQRVRSSPRAPMPATPAPMPVVRSDGLAADIDSQLAAIESDDDFDASMQAGRAVYDLLVTADVATHGELVDRTLTKLLALRQRNREQPVMAGAAAALRALDPPPRWLCEFLKRSWLVSAGDFSVYARSLSLSRSLARCLDRGISRTELERVTAYPLEELVSGPTRTDLFAVLSELDQRQGFEKQRNIALLLMRRLRYLGDPSEVTLAHEITRELSRRLEDAQHPASEAIAYALRTQLAALHEDRGTACAVLASADLTKWTGPDVESLRYDVDEIRPRCLGLGLAASTLGMPERRASQPAKIAPAIAIRLTDIDRVRALGDARIRRVRWLALLESLRTETGHSQPEDDAAGVVLEYLAATYVATADETILAAMDAAPLGDGHAAEERCVFYAQVSKTSGFSARYRASAVAARALGRCMGSWFGSKELCQMTATRCKPSEPVQSK